MHPHHRKAVVDQVADQLVHERIFGALQRFEIDPRGVQEGVRIDRAGMRRIENDRGAPDRRFGDLEGGGELTVELGHRRPPLVKSARLLPLRQRIW